MATDDTKRKKSGSVNFEQARERGRQGWEYWDKGNRSAQDDIRFLAGHQWSEADMRERGNDRITLTINDLGQYMDKVIGDLRQNPTAINVIPADFAAAKTKFVSINGREYDATEVYAGLIRQIEYKCSAKDHYNLAGQHAAESGLGYLRLYSDYNDMVSFNQDLRIERIKNRFGVFCDPMASEPDWSDQNWCFIPNWIKRDDFVKQHPTANASQIIDGATNGAQFWGKEGYLQVTEYYWREEYEFQIAQLDDGSIISDGGNSLSDEEKEDAERTWELARAGNRIGRTRKHKSYRIKWAKITYHDVLEGPYILPGTIIPVAPVIGKRIEGDEDVYHYGLVRFAKEPKRMENFWLSSATERVAQAPKAPYLVTDTMIQKHKAQWDSANRGLKPYLVFTPDSQQPTGPQREMQPTMPAGEIQMMMQMREIVKGAVGLHDAAIGKDTNKQSGRALLALENSANVGNFVFTDNLRSAVSYIGRCLLEWIPSIYDSERIITIRHDNGETDTIKLNQVEDGKLVNDIRAGTFDQDVTTGPAYATLRQQAVDNMTLLFQSSPDMMMNFADLWFGNMDFPGAKQMAKRARKMVPPELLDETELTEEEKNAPPPEPTPQEQAMMELEAKGIEAAMAGHEADIVSAEADIAQAEAKKVTAEASVARDELKTQATVAQAEASIVASADKVEGQRLNMAEDVMARAEPAPAAAPSAAPSAAPTAGTVSQEEFAAFRQDVGEALKVIAQAINTLKPADPVAIEEPQNAI